MCDGLTPVELSIEFPRVDVQGIRRLPNTSTRSLPGWKLLENSLTKCLTSFQIAGNPRLLAGSSEIRSNGIYVATAPQKEILK